MRGNEIHDLARIAIRQSMFSIPMRGNEVRDADLAAAGIDEFSIPMRGNEQGDRRRGRVSQREVFNPHEG